MVVDLELLIQRMDEVREDIDREVRELQEEKARLEDRIARDRNARGKPLTPKGRRRLLDRYRQTAVRSTALLLDDNLLNEKRTSRLRDLNLFRKWMREGKARRPPLDRVQ